MSKTISLFALAISLIFVLFSSGFAQESLTITTYYPSPYGSYNNLYVAGNLGIGTTNPISKLQLYGSVLAISQNGGSNSLYLHDPSNGHIWQIGQTATNDDIYFHDGTDFRVTFQRGGNVGIGTTNPGAKLEVNGTLKVDSLTTGGSALYINGGVLSSSDIRMKDHITNFPAVLDKINALRPVNFTWKKTGERDEGFVAQEVEPIFPELVGDISKDDKGIFYSKFVPYLVKAIQEQQREIASLKSEIRNLKAKLAK